MKKYRKLMIIAGIFLTTLLLTATNSFAQIGDPSDPIGDPDAPIDGGVGILIAAGAGYGLKKYRDSRKQQAVS